jgi:hypothetical protein
VLSQTELRAGFVLQWHAEPVIPCRLVKPLVPAIWPHQPLR